MLLDGEVGEVLVGVLDVVEVVFGAADAEVELGEDVDLQWVEAGDEGPLADVEFAQFVEVGQEQRLLDVLLNDFGFRLGLAGVLLEFLQAVVDAVDAEATGIVAGLDDPDVVDAIGLVLRDVLLHLGVAFGDSVHQVQGRLLPARALGDSLRFDSILRAAALALRSLRQHCLQRLQILLAEHEIERQLREVFDGEVQLRVLH